MRLFFACSMLAVLVASCAGTRRSERFFTKNLPREIQQSPVFRQSFTGFTLLDPATGRILCDVNGDHYFIPASNTKIMTLYACLKVLGDSVPGLRYIAQDSSLYVFGTGDPSFLHPQFQQWRRSFSFLKTSPNIYRVPNRDGWTILGPGWAWDDIDEYYSPEMSDLPVYGNVRRLYATADGRLALAPAFWQKTFFRDSVAASRDSLQIARFNNQIHYNARKIWAKDFERWIPIRNAGFETRAMLSDTLKKSMVQLDASNPEWSTSIRKKTLFSTPIDTVLRRMMHQSDNFIAEQMLLVCAGKKFDLLRQDTVIRWILDFSLANLPQRPKWSDGSGLSRYNLNSPQSLTQVLLRLWQEQPRERLFSLFPAGGVTGTITDWYKGKNGKPYVFAKSGSMSGVYCLSGYVVRNNGKVLIFSFMHNNFTGSSRPWRAEMQRLLEEIAER